MKRILFAAVAALGIHGLLFAMKFPGLSEKPSERPFPRVLDMRLMGIPHPPRATVETKISEALDARPRDRLAAPPKPPAKKSPVTGHKTPPVTEEKMISRDTPVPEDETVSPHPVVNRAPRPERPDGERPPAKKQSQSGTVQGNSAAVLQEVMPLYRVNTPPPYPRRAREQGKEGTVILDVRVDRQGHVQEVRLAATSGSSLLDRTALASVKQWLFEPARRGTEAVEKWVRIPIRFQLQ